MNGGSFLHGISLGWNSVFESLYQLFDDKWFSWTFLLASFGAALTCVIAGIFRNRFGTKFAIFVFSIPNVVGWLLLILGDNAVSVRFFFQNVLMRVIHSNDFRFILDNFRSITHRTLEWSVLPHHSILCWRNCVERSSWNVANFLRLGCQTWRPL